MRAKRAHREGDMKSVFLIAAALLSANAAASAQADIAPTGTLRAVLLATNPAQSVVVNRETGERRGVSVDLARELARRIGKPLDLKPIASPPAVIEAVRSGQADIGFVAYEATRLGTVEFSQTYLLVQQSFLVRGDSPIRAVTDIDKRGQKIGGTRNDSMMLCLKRVLKQAAPTELDNNTEAVLKALNGGEIDALGANRQRLTTYMKDVPGSRILPQNFFNVPQNVVVPMGKPEVIAAVNALIDDLRGSGFLRDSAARSGAVGIEAAPAGPVSQHGCPG
jgi:polar amino acid transport system substrate-binding protein